MAPRLSTLVVTNLTGRNGYDSPTQIPDDQCVEALNVDFFDGTFARKRGGAAALSMTFSSGGPFTGQPGSLVRFVPGNDETAAELWAFDNTPLPGRLAGGTSWVEPTMTDALANAIASTTVQGASFGGMLFLCYDTTQNRLHVWDSSDSKVRRVGLATPDPPTVATQGGAGLSFTRHYRIRTVDISGSDTKRRSEASTSVSITITDDAGVTVTRPTLPSSEDETHWEVEYADAAAGPWYRASQVASATSTYSDTASSISTTNLSAEDGINYPPPSARYILSDDNRLLLAGAFETSGGFVTPKNNRVWFTPVAGSSDIGDAERIPSGNYVDVEAAITGLGGPINGAVVVFAYRRIWVLTPTGVVEAPYRRHGLGSGIGCIDQRSVVLAEDEHGNPALYFWSHRGPYRLGRQGLQYIGMDIEDLTATINLAATNGPCHAVYHADKHQVWFWFATGSNNDPDTKVVFDTQIGRTEQGNAVRRGWARHNGLAAAARCSVMFSNTVGAAMSRDLKPYISQQGAANRVWKCDTGTDDAGTAFQAYVDTKEYAPWGLGSNGTLYEPSLLAAAATGVTITAIEYKDFGLTNPGQGQVLLTAAGNETHLQKKFEGYQDADAGSFHARIGDNGAASNAWTLDAFIQPWGPGAHR